MIPAKVHENFPLIDHKDFEISELPENKFKMTILGKLSKIQENTDGHLSELRKMAHEEKERFNRER